MEEIRDIKGDIRGEYSLLSPLWHNIHLSGAYVSLRRVRTRMEIMHTTASINKTCTRLAEDGSARRASVMLLSVTAAAAAARTYWGCKETAFGSPCGWSPWKLACPGRREGGAPLQAQARHHGIYATGPRVGSKPQLERIREKLG